MLLKLVLRSEYLKLYLFTALIFAGLNLKADPWYCSGIINCNYYPISSARYLCSGESLEIFARNPSPNIIYPNPSCVNPTYSWQKLVGEAGGIADFQPIGVTTNNITISTTGLYRCYVGCSGGGYYTSSVQFYVSTNDVSITSQPEPDNVCLGEAASFGIQTSGDNPKYQWQVKKPGDTWKNMTNEDSKNLYFMPDSADHLSEYKCYVSNGCNSVYSNVVQLGVDMPTEIFIDPASVSVCESSAAGFSVSAGGSNLNYSWQEQSAPGGSWINLSSSGNYMFDQDGNLTINSSASGMNGYSYRAIITGTCDPLADTSEAAILSIKDPPVFTLQPQNDTVCDGETAWFGVEVSGTPPFSYKWQKGGKTVKDWSSEAFLEFQEAGLDDNEDVQVLVSDQCFSTSNAVTSDLASLVVKPPPLVSLGEDRRICSGTFTDLSAGQGYSSYSWSTGDSVYMITVSDQGSYSVTVEDADGCTGSDAIFIITDAPVPDIDIGSDSSICMGEEITLSAAPGYDWYAWSDGGTGQTMKVSSTGEYWIRAGNNNTVCEAGDTVNILVSEPYSGSEICLVTIDENSGKYLLIWERAEEMGIAEYNLYREGSWIGTVAYDDLSIYLDQEADPETRPYRYEMTITDTCGNESGFTPYHIPIFLQYTGYIDGVNLSWSKYQVQGTEVEFTGYSVYKGSDSLQLSALEENIPPEVSVYIDRDIMALENRYFYRIAGILGEPCNPSGGDVKKAGTGPYYHSLSNMDDNKLKSLNINHHNVSGEVHIYPNPASEMVSLEFQNPSAINYTLYLFDVSGKMLRSYRDINGREYTFSVSDLSPGYYYLQLSGEKHYQGTLIIK